MTKRDLRHLLKAPTQDAVLPQKNSFPVLPLLRNFHVYPQKDGTFACGFCRKTYRTTDYAWMCVATCSEPFVNDLRVSSHVVGMVTYHYCPVCLKQFLNREDAVLCVEQCRERVMMLLPSEASRISLFAAYNAENEERARSVSDLDRGSENVFSESILSGQLLSQGNAAQDGISDDELNNLVPLLNTGAGASELDFAADDGAIPSALVDVAMHGTVDVSGSTASENQAETSDDQNVMAMGSAVAADEDTKPKEIRIKWKPGLKPFRRQDAYYVCNGCAAKYFSKVEAEKCFASHPMDMPNKPAGS